MQTKTYDNEEQWLADRLGKVSGTKADGIMPKRGGAYGKTFWEILAERVCEPSDLSATQAMERGNTLEDEAIRKLETATNLEFDNRKTIWFSDEIEGLQVSPDGVGITDSATACEIKCLNSAHHLEAYFSKDYPKSSTLYKTYKVQARQYFQVNLELQKLYVGFFDPRSPVDFHYIVIEREQIAEELEEERSLMQAALEAMKDYENQLIKF